MVYETPLIIILMYTFYASNLTHRNRFQTNQPEHESDDRAGDTVTPVCVTNKKDMALQQQTLLTFVTVWYHTTIGQTQVDFVDFHR